MAVSDLIQIIRRGKFSHVFIDGKELPGSIPRDPGSLIVNVDPDELPTITVRLQALRVDVVNDADDPLEKPSEEGGEPWLPTSSL